ncbi:MAG TPA: TolC family protein [Terriglobia bacterium]|nr:TolC family protein [Terriglobia bacterium]
MRRRLRVATLAVLLLCMLSRVAGVAHAQAAPPALRIDLDQAIHLALTHNHALKASQMQIAESQADEVTASLRPNPVLTWDSLFVPFFSPSQLNSSYLNNITEFDALFAYTIERGHKRRARIQAARDQTQVVRSQVQDNERSLTFNVAQQFITVLLAKSTFAFARQNLAAFQQTLNVSEEQYKKGAISEGDLLKIKLQMLQFQQDVSSAELAHAQALVGLRQLLGYDAVPSNYDVIGNLTYTPLHGNKEDMQALALNLRPDLKTAKEAVTAAQSDYRLAKANGKRDLTTSAGYTRVGGANNASFIFNIEIPIFDRNQGNIARAHAAITQSQESEIAAQEAVMSDVSTAYDAVNTGQQIVQLYRSGYLKEAKDSLDISQYAYQRGAVSLLDFLDAERSYRNTQLAYRQTLAAYMLATEQLREAVGTRQLP